MQPEPNSTTSGNAIHVDPTAEERQLYDKYLAFLTGSGLLPRPLDVWVRYYRENAPEQPTAQEREMYRHYLELIAECGALKPRSLETWVADYRKHQMRPPTVLERKMYAEYVESARD